MSSSGFVHRYLVLVAAGLSLLPGGRPVDASDSPGNGTSFVEVTESVGLDFRHDAGEDGSYPMPASLGAGVALLDYDGDGDLDIYLLQGGPLGASSGVERPGNRLYRQEDSGRFVDVSTDSGLDDRGYGMGVAAGDIDNDGDVDVYVSNYGPDALYVNEGDGTFRQLPGVAGIEDDKWSASALFCDVDRDGALDLFVTRYVEWGLERACFGSGGGREYCGPNNLPGTVDTLLRNQGGGVFEEIRRSSGVGTVTAPSLGAVCLDMSGDQRPDIFVAVDGKANSLWVQQGDRTFEDEALLNGVAVNAFGLAEAGMGVVAADFDADGSPDLLLSHFSGETNTLYRNQGLAGFVDVSAGAGMGRLTLSMTGFGIAPLDYDHDGDLDVAVVNGRIEAHREVAGDTLDDHWDRYAEPNLLLANDGRGGFDDVSAGAGRFGSLVEMSRSLAVGDVDGDGDLDLLATNTGRPARLFRNEAEKKGSWLMVRALTSTGPRDAYGSRVRLRIGEGVLVRHVQSGYGYLASHDPRVHFGVPEARETVDLSIVWPDGGERVILGVPIGRILTVIEKGRVE